MMNKELIYVIGQMATEKGIDKEVLFEALESALLSASKKTMGVADNARMELDRHTGALRVFARKKVVESVSDAKLEIALNEARKLNAEADLEDEIEAELPEIAEGIVQVKAAAREPGERAKVAVVSTKRDVDPIGACVGLRGTRIQVISRELRSEKIDIVEWAADPATFVARALSPAKVSSVTLGPPDESGEARAVLVIVPDNQLSLAIGKKGQNARLAAKLTGLHVDIKSEGEVEEERRLLEEERTWGQAALAEFPGLGPQMVDRLSEHGLFSPVRIVRAGLEALEAIPGLGEKKAAAVLAAAEDWITRHPPVEPEPEAPPESTEDIRAVEGESQPEGEAPPESVARTSAE